MSATEFARDQSPTGAQSSGVPGDHLAADQRSFDTHCARVGGNHLAGDHWQTDHHVADVASTILPDAKHRTSSNVHARPAPLASEQASDDAHEPIFAGNPLPADQASTGFQPIGVGGFLLAFAASSLDDIEKTRIAAENRLRAATANGVPADQYEAHLQLLQEAEHQATLNLQRAMRKHPLGAWVKRTVGIGEKQGARLIAAIGDPYWNTLEDRPRRGPAELWAYCGYAPGQKRRKGEKSNWNADAKMRARLIAESCIKHAHSPYRSVYDAARVAWADHETSDLHKHNHALRCVAKAILKDLYLTAKDFYR